MNPEDDRALLIAMILFLISAGLLIATARENQTGDHRSEIPTPVASSTIRPNQITQ